jgi:two-component system chemotaxis response regulator CheY
MSDQVLAASGKVALVIDDIMSARMVLSDMLKDLGFTTCLEAKDGSEALQLLEKGPVNLIFCDFLMSGMNGIDFLKALKEQQSQDIPPVVFVSSIGDVQSVEAALKLGAADYLVKPLNFRKLRRKIEVVFGAQEVPAGS